MKLVDPEETIVLVTGQPAVNGERDRAFADRLKAEIDARGLGHAYRRAVLVSDRWYLENELFQMNPTIAIGGPGVNEASARFAESLPTVLGREERVFVQADFEDEPKRAALWGVDAAATGDAVDAFMTEGFLDDLLGRVWRFRVETFL
ncbi:MAG: hypothetical protein H0W67_06095 [Gemmatimonadales bacterium]|nr:hypothetical protein [Gemmatimonadales bacterium]